VGSKGAIERGESGGREKGGRGVGDGRRRWEAEGGDVVEGRKGGGGGGGKEGGGKEEEEGTRVRIGEEGGKCKEKKAGERGGERAKAGECKKGGVEN